MCKTNPNTLFRIKKKSIFRSLYSSLIFVHILDRMRYLCYVRILEVCNYFGAKVALHVKRCHAMYSCFQVYERSRSSVKWNCLIANQILGHVEDKNCTSKFLIYVNARKAFGYTIYISIEQVVSERYRNTFTILQSWLTDSSWIQLM